MELHDDIMAIERYETASLPEILSNVEKKYKKDLKYLNKKYEKDYEVFSDVPANLLESELDNIGAIIEMSYIKRNYPEAYERYVTTGEFYNENDPYLPLDQQEDGGVPPDIFRVLSSPDKYEVSK